MNKHYYGDIKTIRENNFEHKFLLAKIWLITQFKQI